jgi:hypothetical protein
LYTELDIPTEASGTVGSPQKPKAKRTSSGERGSQPRKSSRQRQRTRGGKPATGHPVAAGATNGEADASPTDSVTAASGDGAHAARRRRRRRPRKSAGVAASAN